MSVPVIIIALVAVLVAVVDDGVPMISGKAGLARAPREAEEDRARNQAAEEPDRIGQDPWAALPCHLG